MKTFFFILSIISLMICISGCRFNLNHDTEPETAEVQLPKDSIFSEIVNEGSWVLENDYPVPATINVIRDSNVIGTFTGEVRPSNIPGLISILKYALNPRDMACAAYLLAEPEWQVENSKDVLFNELIYQATLSPRRFNNVPGQHDSYDKLHGRHMDSIVSRMAWESVSKATIECDLMVTEIFNILTRAAVND